MKNNKIGIIGTRGIPAKYGGFETFAEEISPLLVDKGYIVTVYCDENNSENKLYNFKGVRLVYQKTTKTKHSLLFYLEGIYMALKKNDLILVTGTAGAYFYFLNIFYHKKIITNTDGVESRRAKWSYLKKLLIKISEILTINFSDHLIADSQGISQYLRKAYPKLSESKLSTIEYGAHLNNYFKKEYLDKYNLKSNEYFLVVARLEPENNIQMILEGFLNATTNKQLVVVGSHIKNSYVLNLLKMRSDKIHFVGGVFKKEELATLRTAAFSYIHGHSVGGTNPSLLEALGSSNIAICHDNVFNREVTDNKQLYFRNSNDLKIIIEQMEEMDESTLKSLKLAAKVRIENYYTWDNIAEKYATLFKTI